MSIDARAPARMPAEKRRRQLLDVALPVFAAKDFHRTSMEEIAEAAGVSKPVLYQHFISKSALYLQLLHDVGAQLSETLTAAIDGAGGPRQAVEAGFSAYFRFVARHPDAFQLLFGSGARREEEFREAVDRAEEAIAEAVGARIEATLGAEHRRVLAFAVLGLAETVSRHWLADRLLDLETAEQLGRRVAELAWFGLRGIRVS